MIICHNLKTVFLHIPKTGDTSIRKALGLKGKKFIYGESKHHVLPHDIPKDYFTFSFVRNPWDRLISYYLFRTWEGRRQRKIIHPQERKFGFKDWLFHLDEFALWDNINPEFSIAISPQVDILGDLPDFIGRFENLEADFKIVCERIGIAPSVLINKNPTKSKTAHYSSYYDDEARAWVGERFCRDIEAYAYSFQTNSSPCSEPHHDHLT